MDVEKLREELERDEGCVYNIYLDHLGYRTFGSGHLVREADPENGVQGGAMVSEDRVKEAFESDINTVLRDCNKLYSDFHYLPEEAQQIIANMMFNLGRPRLSKFAGMKRGVDARDWDVAADEMVDSRWYRQVGARAERLVNRMRDVN